MGPRDLPQTCYRCKRTKEPSAGTWVPIPGRCHDRRFVCYNCQAGVNGRPETRGRSRKISPLEKEVQAALISSGYRFEREHPVGSFWVDFAVPALRLAIEAQSGVHNSPHRKVRDRAKRKVLEQLGWHVVYIWNPDAEGKTSVAIQRREAEITDGTDARWGIGENRGWVQAASSGSTYW